LGHFFFLIFSSFSQSQALLPLGLYKSLEQEEWVPVQVPLGQVPLVQVPPVQVLPVQVPPVQVPPVQVLGWVVVQVLVQERQYNQLPVHFYSTHSHWRSCMFQYHTL
jgi:hypothetical protein